MLRYALALPITEFEFHRPDPPATSPTKTIDYPDLRVIIGSGRATASKKRSCGRTQDLLCRAPAPPPGPTWWAG